MTYLGVDYGRRKIGVSISEGSLAQPLGVLYVHSVAEAVAKLERMIQTHGASCVVIGVSEGKMADETHVFGDAVSQLGVKVYYWDETLSSQTATSLLIEGGKSKKARRKDQDAVAASLILQSYLDSLKEERKA